MTKPKSVQIKLFVQPAEPPAIEQPALSEEMSDEWGVGTACPQDGALLRYYTANVARCENGHILVNRIRDDAPHGPVHAALKELLDAYLDEYRLVEHFLNVKEPIAFAWEMGRDNPYHCRYCTGSSKTGNVIHTPGCPWNNARNAHAQPRRASATMPTEEGDASLDTLSGGTNDHGD